MKRHLLPLMRRQQLDIQRARRRGEIERSEKFGKARSRRACPSKPRPPSGALGEVKEGEPPGPCAGRRPTPNISACGISKIAAVMSSPTRRRHVRTAKGGDARPKSPRLRLFEKALD